MVRTPSLCGVFNFSGELGPALYTLHDTCTSSTYTYFLSGFQDPETFMTPGSLISGFGVRSSGFGVREILKIMKSMCFLFCGEHET